MYFLFINKTYSHITKEPYGFKMQIFKVLFSELREPTNKYLCLYDLTWKTKTTLQVSIGFSFSGLLTRMCIGKNYGGEKFCRISLHSNLKWYLSNSDTINFCAPKCVKNGLLCKLFIFAYFCCTKINGAQKSMRLRYLIHTWISSFESFYQQEERPDVIFVSTAISQTS